MKAHLKKLFLLLLIVVHRPVLGQVKTNSSLDLASNLQESRQSVFNNKILSSIVKIHFLNGHCTGMLVSDEGHLLTANHCLFDNNSKFKSAEEIMKSSKLDGTLFITLSNKENLPSLEVSYKIVAMGAGNFPASSAQYFNSHIFSTGPTGDRIDQMVKDATEKNLGSQSDWVILKLDMKNISHGCLPVAESIIEPLIAAGYPGHAGQGLSQVTKEGLNFSTGSLISPSSCEEIINPRFKSDRIKKLNTPFLDQERVLISTTLIKQGMSGGPVLNDNGELTAVISANPFMCGRQTSILVPISGIKKQIDALNNNLPSYTESSETIFQCSQN